MPSFKVRNAPKESTFTHFYTSLIEQSNQEHDASKSKSVFNMAKIAAIAIFIKCGFYMVAYSWDDMLYFEYTSMYEKYKLYYLHVWIRYILLPFSLVLLMNQLFFNGYSHYSFKHNIIVAFIVCIIINGTIVTILAWQFYEYYNYIWYWKWFCNNMLHNNASFQSQCKYYYSLLEIYTLVFVYPFCLFLTILLNYLIFLMAQNGRSRILTTITTHTQNDENIRIEMQDLNESLLNHDDNPQLVMMQQDKNTPMNKYKCSFCLYVVFIFVILLFSCAKDFMETVLYYYTENVNYYFYYLLFTTSFFKLLLKFLSRRIDVINMTCNCNSNKWYHKVSLEMFIEFAINYMYFRDYYQLFVFELSSKDISNVLFVIFLHLLSELCQSIIRFSAFYFDRTKQIYDKMRSMKSNDKCFQMLTLVFLDVFKDDSNLNIWRIRHSIDSSIRCLSLICAFLRFGMTLITLPQDIFQVSGKSTFYNGILYCFMSLLSDLIYFFVLFLGNYYFHNHFNIWKPIISMYTANKNVLICVFCASWFMSYF